MKTKAYFSVGLTLLLLTNILSAQHTSPFHGLNQQAEIRLRIQIDTGHPQANRKQLDSMAQELRKQGLDLTISGDASFDALMNVQQYDRLRAYPFVTDIQAIADLPEHKRSGTIGIIVPPPQGGGHSCDDYPVPPNPSTYTEYSGDQVKMEYYSSVLREEYPGLIYLPSQNGRPVSGKFPLAILIHGRHYDYDWYQEIQQHLARNGIASASIQYSEEHAGQDYYDSHFLQQFENHMQVLLGNLSSDYNPAHGKFKNRIALIGHSMGGGFAMRAAQWLQEENFDVDLMSVVNLAPNPQEDDWYITTQEAQGLLVIFGSNDDDTGVNKPSSSGFLSYDRSGYIRNEYTFNGYWKNRFTKSFAYIKGANHKSFIDVGHGQGPHHDVALGYINAYMRWSLKDDHAQHVIFKQQHAFYGQSPEVSLQYSDGSYRRVLDHFEGPYLNWSALGGNIHYSNIGYDKADAQAQGNPHKSGHETQVLTLNWQGASNIHVPKVEFSLPIPFSFGIDYRDLRRLRYLSFRMGQLANAADSNEELEFYIRFTSKWNNVTKTQRIKLSDVGAVPSPLANGQDSQTKTAMNTVLVPLCAFDEIDRARVTKIGFEFNHADRNRGGVQMDSLEFIY